VTATVAATQVEEDDDDEYPIGAYNLEDEEQDYADSDEIDQSEDAT
jgi:hypothetical protein